MITIKLENGPYRNFYPIIHKYVELGFNPDLIDQDLGLLRLDINPKYKHLSFREKMSIFQYQEDASVYMHYSKYSRRINPVTATVRQIVEVGSYYWISPCLSIESNASVYSSDSILMKILKYTIGVFIKDRPSILSDLSLAYKKR